LDNYLIFLNELESIYPDRATSLKLIIRGFYIVYVEWLCGLITVTFHDKDLYKDAEGSYYKGYQSRLLESNEILIKLFVNNIILGATNEESYPKKLVDKVTLALSFGK